MLGTKVVDKICIVPGCSSVGGKLYRVPKNKLRWLEWKRACPFLHDIDERLLSHARFCQVHFDSECFGESSELKLDAVPTLQLPSRPHGKGNISVISSSNTIITTGRWSSTDKDTEKQCVLCGRSQSSVKDSNEKVILSRFPLDVPSCREWVKYVGLKHLAKMTVTELNTKVFLCQNHFRPPDNRVPNINLPNHALDDCLLTKFGLDAKKVELKVTASETKKDLLVNSRCLLCRRKANEGAILFKFPLDPKTCRLWIKHIGLKSLAKMSFKDINETFYLCENHFKPHCIRDGVLLEKSIPTVNLPLPPLTDDLIRTNVGRLPEHEGVQTDIDELNTIKIKTETDSTSTRPTSACRSDRADEILTLFLSYAGTFRKLQKKFQAMLKLDLAKIFSRYEMKNAAYLEERRKLEEAEKRKKFRHHITRTPLSASNNIRPKLKRTNFSRSAPIRVTSEVSEPVRIAPVPVIIAPEAVSIAPEPVIIAPEPVIIAPEPVIIASEAVSIAPEPVSIAPEPVRIAPEPVIIAPEPVRIAPEPDGITPETDGIAPSLPSNETITDTSTSYQPSNKKVKPMTGLPKAIENKAMGSAKTYSRVKKKVPESMPKLVNIAPRPPKFELAFKTIETQPHQQQQQQHFFI